MNSWIDAIGTIFSVLVFLGIVLSIHYAFVCLFGWLLTRSSVAVWRQELVSRRWQFVAYVFGFSPIIALPLAFSSLVDWGPALAGVGWFRVLPTIGTGLILMVVPALAGSWLALPEYEGESYSDKRAWLVALVFFVSDAIGAIVVNSILDFN